MTWAALVWFTFGGVVGVLVAAFIIGAHSGERDE